MCFRYNFKSIVVLTSLTHITGPLGWALASESADQVDTGAAVLAGFTRALVDV